MHTYHCSHLWPLLEHCIVVDGRTAGFVEHRNCLMGREDWHCLAGRTGSLVLRIYRRTLVSMSRAHEVSTIARRLENRTRRLADGELEVRGRGELTRTVT